MNEIDTEFDLRSDSKGLDPDFASPTLRRYHQLLWSKPLPSGVHLNLKPGSGLYLSGSAGDLNLNLASDTISNSMAGHKALAHFVPELPVGLVDDFRTVGSTIGARILFPGDRVDKKPTINVARGFHPRIKDRFDLTLECVRLFYKDQPSPLSIVFSRYKEFFDLFENFEGYVKFFLLQDMVHHSKVKFFTEMDDPFSKPPTPQNLNEYLSYASRSMEFIAMRNQRIRSLN